jgi:T-complex protein 1 subunit theta
MFPVYSPQHVKSIADSGCNVIVSGGKVGELYLHYCNKYNLLVVRLLSKFDLRRLCKAIGATPLPRIVSIMQIFEGCEGKQLQ